VVKLRDRIRNQVIRQRTKVTDIAHRIGMLSAGGLAISAVEPTTARVNKFWSGDRISVNVGRPQARWSVDLRRTAGRSWMRVVEDRKTWREIGEAYVQQWPIVG
jgi:hypothetical protein